MANQVLFNEDTYTRCLAEVPKVRQKIRQKRRRGVWHDVHHMLDVVSV